MNNTAELLTKYINIFHPNHKGVQGVPLFYNRNGDKLTRAGISYILSKYVNLAKQKQPSLIPKKRIATWTTSQQKHAHAASRSTVDIYPRFSWTF